MRIFALVAVAVVSLLGACTAPPTIVQEEEIAPEEEVADAGPKATPKPPTTKTPASTKDSGTTAPTGACNLHNSGLGFAGTCDTCMQEKCCVETVACFTAPDCATLHTCLVACNGKPGDGGGGGGGGGDGGGKGDGGGGGLAGTPCQKLCYAAHSPSLAGEAAYSTCNLTKCSAECK